MSLTTIEPTALRKKPYLVRTDRNLVKSKNAQELFLEKVVNSESDILKIAEALEFVDLHCSDQERNEVIGLGFAELMDRRKFDFAVQYFSLLKESEKNYILDTRKYNYGIRDLDFRKLYRLETNNGKRFVQGQRKGII